MPVNLRSDPGATRRASHAPGAPWWRFPMVWLVLAGPAAVIVAGIATMVIAFRNADTVLSGPSPVVTGARAVPEPTMPAVQARNHAATLGH